MNKGVFLLAGPLAAILILVFPELDPANPLVSRMAAVAVWMGIWWLTEAVPLAITALLPVAFFPLLGIMDSGQVAGSYSNSIIMLFLGGFIIALAMQRWELHRRMALLMVRQIGLSPHRLMLGFMVATAFLSMWISNTAASMMMVPIAISIILQFEQEAAPSGGQDAFGKGLLLSIAYAASIGGLATLIGTPANMIMAQMYRIQFPHLAPISFSQWLLMALPLSLILLVVAWRFLAHRYCRAVSGAGEGGEALESQWRQLGPMSFEERAVLGLFITTAVLWLTRADLELGAWHFYGWGRLFGGSDGSLPVTEGTVAILMATLLFVIPSRQAASGRLMNWDDLAQFPWSIFLLFGGGFALANGVQASGLSQWLSGHLTAFSTWPPMVLVAVIVISLKALSEFTSNTASIQMVLPVLASIAVSSGIHPLFLMIPAALSASCPFMLPVATPPNAIVFGTERLQAMEMAKAGLILNWISIILIVAGVFPVVSRMFGISLP